MNKGFFQRVFSIGTLVLMLAGAVTAQSSRPRRVRQTQKPAEEPLLRPETKTNSTARSNPNAPLLDVQPVKPVVNTAGTGDTSQAFPLLQQKQCAAAAKEAKDSAAPAPKEPEP